MSSETATPHLGHILESVQFLAQLAVVLGVVL
jgi:hypothetical protein